MGEVRRPLLGLSFNGSVKVTRSRLALTEDPGTLLLRD